MKFTLASIVAVAASLTAVNAQTGITACVLQCVTEAAATAGCSSITDTTCVCTSADFQNAAVACLTSNCSTEEQQAAVQLQQQTCAGQTVSGSLSSTISAPSASGSLDASALSSLSNSIAMTTSGASASASSAVSGASASASSVASGVTASGASVVSAASSVVGGAGSSVASVLSSVTGNAAGKVDLGIKWGVVGGGAMGMALGAMALL